MKVACLNMGDSSFFLPWEFKRWGSLHLSVADALVGQQGLSERFTFQGEGAEGACMEGETRVWEERCWPSVSLKRRSSFRHRSKKSPFVQSLYEIGFSDLEATTTQVESENLCFVQQDLGTLGC